VLFADERAKRFRTKPSRPCGALARRSPPSSRDAGGRSTARTHRGVRGRHRPATATEAATAAAADEERPSVRQRETGDDLHARAFEERAHLRVERDVRDDDVDVVDRPELAEALLVELAPVDHEHDAAAALAEQ